jgi:hypothetical protein
MAEAKKIRAKSAKNSPKADLIEMAAAAAAETVESAMDAKPASPPAPSKIRSTEGGVIFSSVREQGDALRRAMHEAVTVSAQGALEVNDKIIEVLQTQSNAALDLWRTTITTSDLPAALQAQSNATRQAYEAASAQWKDIAETTARWMTKSFEPLQSALNRQGH